ncbi:uncharacterized protein LOC130760243 [Actinidia eriantha]|uniref:uncharacterized protein LOC130760243 n=1 Tax=Actinidia eriantha TaxID=165200 RepID=UPI00258461CF|nr:uncharacterized protein LOC130760243 [Actinidia eriantha]
MMKLQTGGNAEEAQSSADKTSMAQVVKGTVLMVCRTCVKKGDHWTANCPYKDLGPQLEVVLMNRPPSADATANSSSCVPPGRRGGGAERSDGLEMRRWNDDYTIRIGNPSEDTLDFDLVELCHPFGHVLRAHVPKDFKTCLSRGYGFVNFVYWEDAERAINKLDGYDYENLILRVEMARQKSN